MNTDRFLTRVWDKQEKKMIYKHQPFAYDGVTYVFESVTDDAVIASEFNPRLSVCQIICLELEDRFIPMQCWGLPDKNEKLIYDDDIGKIDFQLYRALFNGFAFGFSSVTEACNVLVPTALTRNKIEIIGNYWENPKLMEQNKGQKK